MLFIFLAQSNRPYYTQDGLLPRSEIIGCPFSDHKFLVASFDLHVNLKAEEVRSSRSYSEKNLKKVKHYLSKVDFSLMERFPKIDDIWGFVKDKVLEAIDHYCPLETFKNKSQNQCPWSDEELRISKNYRDYCHTLFSQSKSNHDLLENKEARREFKKLNRLKIKEQFKTQTTKNFKNSKKFWQFYKSSVKLRSDKSDDCPE